MIHGRLASLGGEGGLIALGKSGPAVFAYNSEGMFRGTMDAGGRLETEVF